MIDIGIVMTDLDGNILDSLFLRIQPRYPERLSPGAFEVNAFDPIKWTRLGALSKATAVDSIISFHNKVAGDKQVLMISYNIRALWESPAKPGEPTLGALYEPADHRNHWLSDPGSDQSSHATLCRHNR